jgi:cobalt/nickel transport system permease protein
LGIVLYLQRANLPVMRINHANVPETDAELAQTGRRVKWWYALGPIVAMALMTPIGLLYNSGAYGEDNPKNDPSGFLQKNHLSAIPSGLNHYTQFWHHALFDGYDFSHDAHPSIGYIVSAFFGAAVVSAILFAILGVARLLHKRRGETDAMMTPQRWT